MDRYPAYGTTLTPLMTKLAEGAKKPSWVALSSVDGMVPVAVVPPHEIVAVEPFKVTVRFAAGLLGHM